MSKLEIFQTAINVATVLIAPIVAVIVGQKLQDKGQKRNINSFSSLLKAANILASIAIRML